MLVSGLGQTGAFSGGLGRTKSTPARVNIEVNVVPRTKLRGKSLDSSLMRRPGETSIARRAEQHKE